MALSCIRRKQNKNSFYLKLLLIVSDKVVIMGTSQEHHWVDVWGTRCACWQILKSFRNSWISRFFQFPKVEKIQSVDFSSPSKCSFPEEKNRCLKRIASPHDQQYWSCGPIKSMETQHWERLWCFVTCQLPAADANAGFSCSIHSEIQWFLTIDINVPPSEPLKPFVWMSNL